MWWSVEVFYFIGNAKKTYTNNSFRASDMKEVIDRIPSHLGIDMTDIYMIHISPA